MKLLAPDDRATSDERRATSHGRRPALRSAVTLTEMLVVLGVIVVALGLSIPAFSVWESRKVQDSINQISGLLKSAQIKALTEHRVLGLFFYVDPDDGSQVIWPIEQALEFDRPDGTADRFQLRDTAPFKLPEPMRVVPADIVLESDTTSAFYWSPEQLVKDDLYDHTSAGAPNPPHDPAPPEPDGTQFHRNFFVMLFGETGSVITDRRVSILDADPTDSTPPVALSPGFHTRLLVSGTGTANGAIGPNLIVNRREPNASAQPLYFVPTDKVLIYRDDVFQVQGDVGDVANYNDDHRRHLKISADPLYVHKVTGEVIKGERVPPDPA